MPTVSIPQREGEMSAHLAVPDTGGPWPGVVVIHDALGMTTDLRNQADWLADNGYLAIAPDLYYWGRRVRCMFAAMRAISSRTGRTFEDIDGARAWLGDRADCTGRVGVIGFCMGGGFALVLATTGDYDVASVNYGALNAGVLSKLDEACPIVASYGADDRSLRTVPDKLERALTDHGIDHDVKVYPGAGHGFLNDHAADETPWWALIGGKLINTGYHEPSALDARTRIIAFLDRHLSSGTR